jgi:hypothetical protein
MAKPKFFLMVAIIPAVAAVIIWLFDRPLRSIIESRMTIPVPGPDLATEKQTAP